MSGLLAPMAAAIAALASLSALAQAVVGAPRLARAAVRLGRRWSRRRAEAQLPLFAEVVARELRAGTPLPPAVIAAARHPDLARLVSVTAPVVRRWDDGADFGECLAAWPEPSEAARLVLAALRLGADAGGDRPRLLEQVAATLHQRMALRAELHSAAAQARASALLLTTAPLGCGALFLAVDPGLATAALGSAAGRASMAAGAMLGVLGWWWGAVLIRRVRP